MWIKPAISIAVLCGTFAQVSAWSIDESCAPDHRPQNIRDILKTIMKWPQSVDKYLGKHNAVDAFARNLFNEQDFSQVKVIINKIGKMSEEDTSGSDTLDPVIYCNQKRIVSVQDATNPSKKTYKDTKNDVDIGSSDWVKKCNLGDGGINAYTFNWVDSDDKPRTFIQLCQGVLGSNGQGIKFADDEFYVPRLNVAVEFLNQIRNSPVYIDNFFPVLFVHTWKVKRPSIKDGHKTYGWRKCTRATEDVALDNAESYAYLALGTYLIGNMKVAISNDGVITDPDADELANPPNGLVGLPWTA